MTCSVIHIVCLLRLSHNIVYWGDTMNKEEQFGKGVKFERVRRITGYLVGTMDKWNDAKRAEEKDRVKHM